MEIAVKRVYETPAKSDGMRILVERLWPRGLTKEKASIDLWIKEIAPSTALRQWFGHVSEKWDEFCTRYWEELSKNSNNVELLKKQCKGNKVTFVYAAKDEQRNSAVALRAFLKKKG